MKLQDYTTWELVEELQHREGVDITTAGDPGAHYAVTTLNNGKIQTVSDSGPATILIVID